MPTLAAIQFTVFAIASFMVFVAIFRYVMRKRRVDVSLQSMVCIGLLVTVGGMAFAKTGAQAGWPWWIYYTVPMLLTVLLPPLYFRMNNSETALYLVLSFLSAPLIHLFFSFFIGWKTYMPFIPIPSLWEF